MCCKRNNHPQRMNPDPSVEQDEAYMTFVNSVQEWATHSSRIELLNCKLKEERKALEKLTPRITTYMEQHDMTKKVIHLQDGKITYSETSTPSAISMTFLGDVLLEYFQQDETRTRECLEFISSKRTIKKSVELKRKLLTPPVGK